MVTSAPRAAGLLRRVSESTSARADEQVPPDFRVGPLEIRPSEMEVLAGGRRAGLTVREFEMLMALVERPDRVVTRAAVYELVWGGPMHAHDRSVDVFVRKIRRKLLTIAPEWSFVHTRFGVGYRFAPERAAGDDPSDGGP